MPFWLCEKRLTGLLRTISVQHQILITLCCMLIAASCTIIYKQLTQPKITIANKQLRKITDLASPEKMQQLAHINRPTLPLEAIPQTLSFFNVAGFYVQIVEQKFDKHNRNAIGYTVKTLSTFEALMGFLESKQTMPTRQLSLQSISRINDHIFEVEFFIPKQKL